MARFKIGLVMVRREYFRSKRGRDAFDRDESFRSDLGGLNDSFLTKSDRREPVRSIMDFDKLLEANGLVFWKCVMVEAASFRSC
jgi:hypothetical protein